jgi:hypothetical protein
MTRDYHKCLNVILELFRQCQTEQPVMEFRRGGKVKMARAICPILGPWLGDNLSNNMMSGRIQHYSKTAVQMTRR